MKKIIEIHQFFQLALILLVVVSCSYTKEDCAYYLLGEIVNSSPEEEEIILFDIEDQSYVDAVEFINQLGITNIGIVSSTVFSKKEVDFFLDNNVLITRENAELVEDSIGRSLPQNNFNKRRMEFTLVDSENHFVKQFLKGVKFTHYENRDFSLPIIFFIKSEVLLSYNSYKATQAIKGVDEDFFKNRSAILFSSLETQELFESPYSCFDLKDLNKAELTYNAVYSFRYDFFGYKMANNQDY